MTNITYFTEVKTLAKSIIDDCMNETENNLEEAMELINDSILHESIDGHMWIIYYSYNLEIIKQSDNEEYYLDNFGSESLEHSLREGGLNGLHQAIAFWAFYADVQEEINEQVTLIEEEEEA